MEVIFVLCNFLKTSLTRMGPEFQDFYQCFSAFIQKYCGPFYEDFSKSLFWIEWNYVWHLILKTIQENWIVIMFILALVYHHRKKKLINAEVSKAPGKKYSLGVICNLVKKCDKPSFVSNVLYVLEENEIDFNTRLPSSKSGLTPFLCACISGSKELVEYMLEHGADINNRSFYQDGPLHIATFACASQDSRHDFSVLLTLMKSGCNINSQNWIGNTPLCVAASYDKGELIRFLIAQGADPSVCNKDGIYPIDFATNAGHGHLTSLLRFKVSDSHVWDFIEPHTPPRIKLGLQTPCKKHLVDSSFSLTSKRKLNTFRTPRPGRCFPNEVYRKSKR